MELSKVLLLVLGTFLGRDVSEVNAEQPWKAQLPILVTFSPMVNEAQFLQPEKADVPIYVTFSPMVTEVMLVHPLKA